MSFSVPNLLSIIRMGIVPLFIIAVIQGYTWQPLVLFAVAGLTDALDGLIARFYHQQTRLGAYLDPAADKLLLVSAYAALAVPGLSPEAVTIPVWVAVMVIARDVLIVIVVLILYLALGLTRFRPTMISKVTTGMQIAAVVVVLIARVFSELAPLAEPLLIATAGLTVASGVNYVYVGNRMAAARAAEDRERGEDREG